jgi:hypothetical protein
MVMFGASGLVFMFCAPGLIFGCTEGVRSRFHVLRVRTLFRWYRGRPILFSCFLYPDMFSAVPRASGLVFMFCAPGHVFMFCTLGLIFDGTEGVRSLFHDLRARTHFQRYRGHQVPFSCFTLLGTFSAVRRASGLDFKFCYPGHVFGGTTGVWSRFHIVRSRTRFPRYRGRRVPFSCFAPSDSFMAVPRASSPVFKFCTPGHIFGGAESVGSCFHVLCARTHFSRSRWRRVPFSCFARRD